MNPTNGTTDRPGVQHADDLRRHLRDIFANPALRRRAYELVELAVKRDPCARCVQLICLSGRQIVDAFWCADFELDLRGIAHEPDASCLVLIGLGPYFPPIATEDVFTRCIASPENLVRGEGVGRSLLDLEPLNVVIDWLKRDR